MGRWKAKKKMKYKQESYKQSSNIGRFVILQKPYKCRICLETFDSAHDFVDHLMDLHFPDMKINLWNKCQLSRDLKELNDGAMW